MAFTFAAADLRCPSRKSGCCGACAPTRVHDQSASPTSAVFPFPRLAFRVWLVRPTRHLCPRTPISPKSTHLHLPAFHSFWCNPETQSGVKSIFSFVCSFPFSGDTLLLTIPDEHHPPHISRAAARSGVTLRLSPTPARQSPFSGRREESCYSAEWGWYPTHIVHWSDVPHQKPRFPQAAHVPPDLPPVASHHATSVHEPTGTARRTSGPAPRPAPLRLLHRGPE